MYNFSAACGENHNLNKKIATPITVYTTKAERCSVCTDSVGAKLRLQEIKQIVFERNEMSRMQTLQTENMSS